jgi:poly(beta-D-mannuronate) lyase
LDGNIVLGQNKAGSGGIRINGEGHVLINNYVADTMGDGLRGALVLRAAGSVDSDDTNGGYEQVRNALIAHNTFINNRQSWNLGELGGKDNNLGARDCELVNNLVVGSDSPLVGWARTPSNLTYDSNILWGATVGHSDGGIQNVDPLLELRPDGFSSPGPASPAIEEGVPVPSAPADLDGQLRSESTPDIGADERIDPGSVLAPISPVSVGPDWLPPGAPFNPSGIELEDGQTVAIRYPGDDRFGYGFYALEYSPDMAAWTPVAPESVDDDLGAGLSESRIAHEAQNRGFWRFVFKSGGEE